MDYALVFDFGGVLMKTATRQPRWAWDDRLGLRRGTVERIVHNSDTWRLTQCGQISVQEYWSDVATQLGIDRSDTDQLRRDYFSADELDDEIVDFLRARRADGQRVALLSNDSLALLDKLHALGIADLFDPLVISAQIGVMKPHPEAYRYVLERLGFAASRAVFIDDMQANVDGALAVGMHGLLYTPTVHLIDALAPYIS